MIRRRAAGRSRPGAAGRPAAPPTSAAGVRRTTLEGWRVLPLAARARCCPPLRDSLERASYMCSLGMVGVGPCVMLCLMVSASSAHEIWPVPADFKLPDLTASEHDAPAPPCSAAAFPHDLNGLKVDGLKAMPEVSSVENCMAACCAAGPSCQVYEWTGSPQSGASCWIGSYAVPTKVGGQGYISRARGNIPPPPPPPPPPFPPGKAHTLDDTKGLGLRWEGIGAISG